MSSPETVEVSSVRGTRISRKTFCGKILNHEDAGGVFVDGFKWTDATRPEVRPQCFKDLTETLGVGWGNLMTVDPVDGCASQRANVSLVLGVLPIQDFERDRLKADTPSSKSLCLRSLFCGSA